MYIESFMAREITRTLFNNGFGRSTKYFKRDAHYCGDHFLELRANSDQAKPQGVPQLGRLVYQRKDLTLRGPFSLRAMLRNRSNAFDAGIGSQINRYGVSRRW